MSKCVFTCLCTQAWIGLCVSPHTHLTSPTRPLQVLDKTGDGLVTLADLEGRYDASRHPDVVAGSKATREVGKTYLRGLACTCGCECACLEFGWQGLASKFLPRLPLVVCVDSRALICKKLRMHIYVFALDAGKACV